MQFNMADMFEDVVDHVPDREALYAEGRRLTFRQLDERANRLAHHLLAQGVQPGEHVGCHMMNGTEYLETMLALFKIRAVPINVNFRYVEEELLYLYNDAQLRAVVFDSEFADRVQQVVGRVPTMRHLVAVGDAAGAQLPTG